MNAITNTWNRRAMLSCGIAGAVFMTALALSGVIRADDAGAATPAKMGNPGRAAIEQKLKAIVLPEVKFEDTSFEEAVDYLHTASVERDTSGSGEKGVRLWIQGKPGMTLPRVSMKLKDVPLGEALARLNALSDTALKIGGTDVAIVPKELTANHEPAPEEIEAGKRTVIALVDIENQPLDSVVKFLNEKSAEKRGPKVAIAGGLDPKTMVNAVRLRDTTLSDAVFFVANDIHCSFKAADGTISFVAR